MTPIKNYESIPAVTGGGEALPAGGYKCVIVKAFESISKTGRPMLCLCLDIADGQYKGHFSRLFKMRKDRDGKDAKWPCIMYLLADEEAAGRFKGSMKAVEDSNSGYKWDWDEVGLKGKRVGVVFREEEYEKRDGSIGVVVKAAWLRNADKVEDAPIPARRKVRQSIALTGGIAPTASNIDEEIPW